MITLEDGYVIEYHGHTNHKIKMYRLLFVSIAVVLAVMFTPHMLCAPVDTVATPTVIKPLERPLLFSITYGKRINTGGNDNADWFGRQKLAHNALTFRLTYFVYRHWAIYGELGFGGKPGWTPPFGGPVWMSESKCGLGLDCSLLSCAGVVYRYEHGRWQFYARAAYGIMSFDLDSYFSVGDMEGSSLIGDAFGENRWTARRSIAADCVCGGLSFGYRTSRTVSIVLDVNYSYPVRAKSEVAIKNESGPSYREVDNSINWYRTSRSWGNNLTVSVGIQFQGELSKAHRQKK